MSFTNRCWRSITNIAADISITLTQSRCVVCGQRADQSRWQVSAMARLSYQLPGLADLAEGHHTWPRKITGQSWVSRRNQHRQPGRMSRRIGRGLGRMDHAAHRQRTQFARGDICNVCQLCCTHRLLTTFRKADWHVFHYSTTRRPHLGEMVACHVVVASDSV